MKVATEGTFAQIEYKFPHPGQTEPAQKDIYVTKVGDQVCGVDYFK
jgi:hypothetical protein